MPTLFDIAKEVKALPAMSTTAQRVVEITGNHDATAMELQEVILYDQALSTHLLKVANSPYYSPRNPITEVQRAVVLLGFEQVKKICLFYATQGILKRPGLAETLLWEHSLGVAIAAREIAEQWHPDMAATAFTCGLLHDVGKSVLVGIKDANYENLMRTFYNDGTPLAELEQHHYGFNHADVGRQVCLHWKLPDTLTTAIAYHHDDALPDDLPQQQTDMAQVLKLANLFAHVGGIGRRDPKLGVEWATAPENPGFPPQGIDDLYHNFIEVYAQERARMEAAAM